MPVLPSPDFPPAGAFAGWGTSQKLFEDRSLCMKLSHEPEITAQRLDAILVVCDTLTESVARMPNATLGPELALVTAQVREMKGLLAQRGNIDELCPVLGTISTTILNIHHQIELVRTSN